MIAEIERHFPRYPDRQAVTLPALHVVHQRLRHVPIQAVVEIAELLGLAPAQVQDTLTFYGFFKQDKPHGQTRAWVCRSISCRAAWRRRSSGTHVQTCKDIAGRNHRGRQADARIRGMFGRLRVRSLHAGRRPVA